MWGRWWTWQESISQRKEPKGLPEAVVQWQWCWDLTELFRTVHIISPFWGYPTIPKTFYQLLLKQNILKNHLCYQMKFTANSVEPHYHDSQGTEGHLSLFLGMDTSIQSFNYTVLALMDVGDISSHYTLLHPVIWPDWRCTIEKTRILRVPRSP